MRSFCRPSVTATSAVRKQRPEDGDADERDDRRPIALDLPSQPRRARDVLVALQRVDARRRSRHDVRDPVPPLRQPLIVHVGDRLRHQTRIVEQLPESIRESGEVMAGQRRANAGVDADKQHADTGTNPVAQWRQTSVAVAVLSDRPAQRGFAFSRWTRSFSLSQNDSKMSAVGHEGVRDLQRDWLVYIIGSVNVTSMSMCPKSMRRNRSVTRRSARCAGGRDVERNLVVEAGGLDDEHIAHPSARSSNRDTPGSSTSFGSARPSAIDLANMLPASYSTIVIRGACTILIGSDSRPASGNGGGAAHTREGSRPVRIRLKALPPSGGHRQLVGLEVHEHVDGVLVHGVELHARHARLDLGVDDRAEQTPHLVNRRGLVHPDAGEIRPALGRARRRRGEVGLAVLRSRRARGRKVQPLRVHGDRETRPARSTGIDGACNGPPHCDATLE